MTKKSTGVYVMRVASRLSGMHPQTLRKYERAGLLSPSRSNTLRLYSDEDIARLRLIKRLVDESGLNLAGVEIALRMRSHIVDLKEELGEAGIRDDVRQRMMDILEEMLRMLDVSE